METKGQPTGVSTLVITRESFDGIKSQTVNARELHSFLEVKTEFNVWFARRCQEYQFVDGIDFQSFLNETSNGRPGTNAEISLDMAKELSMVERNEKGRQARQYFIECEKIISTKIKIPTDPILAQLQIIQSIREHQIALDTKVEAGHIVLNEIVSNVKALEGNMRVENWQQNNLQAAMKSKIDQICSLHPKVDTGELYSRAWRLFKQTFKIPRYNELPAMMYEDGMVCIEKMTIWSFPGLKR